MEELLAIAGMEWRDIQRLCVCGAFGHQQDIEQAQKVGLLPVIEKARIELIGDAALAGCEISLLCNDVEERLADLLNRTNSVNLSYTKYYDDRFINHLRLRPIPPNFPRLSPHAGRHYQGL